MNTQPWIVHHRDGWCALPPDAEPDPEASNDPTLCGQVVVLRGGSKRGRPDCPECVSLLASGEPERSRLHRVWVWEMTLSGRCTVAELRKLARMEGIKIAGMRRDELTRALAEVYAAREPAKEPAR